MLTPRGHIFEVTVMNLDQYVSSDDFYIKLETESQRPIFHGSTTLCFCVYVSFLVTIRSTTVLFGICKHRIISS